MFAIEIEPWHELIGTFKNREAAERVLRKKGFRSVHFQMWMREGERLGEEEFAQIRQIFSPKEHEHI